MPYSRFAVDALGVITIILVSILVLAGLFCILYLIYFHTKIRGQGYNQLGYFHGPWIIRIVFILFAIWWGFGEVVRLNLIRGEGRLLSAFGFRWQETVCKCYIVSSLGFAEPCLYLTVVFLLRASLQKSGTLSQKWNGKTVGYILLFCLPVFALQLVLILAGPQLEKNSLCPHIVNCSVLFGAIISWGILWPLISQRAGDWYPADLGSNDFKGLYGYKVFIAISLILGDGLYNLIKIVSISVMEIFRNSSMENNIPLVMEVIGGESSRLELEKKKRDEVFLKDRIPFWFAGSGYVALAAISTATMPIIFPPLKWYLVLCSYLIAPALAFCNSYGTGLTDWSLASTYGKIGLFIIASLVGSNGGVVAGLAACGVMMSIVSTAADLMQDFKTGYLTLSSAKSMFVSQLVGTAMGCIIAPLTFWMYWNAFDIGSPDSPYKAPYAVIYREMAILGIEGFSELPKHCLALCCGFFVAALAINLLRDVTPAKVSQFIPIPMAMAVPFYIGAYFAIDMFVGTVILFVWEKINKKDAEDFAGAVASGLICGDGIWTIPSAILSIFRINPPICMYFGPSVRT